MTVFFSFFFWFRTLGLDLGIEFFPFRCLLLVFVFMVVGATCHEQRLYITLPPLQRGAAVQSVGILVSTETDFGAIKGCDHLRS